MSAGQCKFSRISFRLLIDCTRCCAVYFMKHKLEGPNEFKNLGPNLAMILEKGLETY